MTNLKIVLRTVSVVAVMLAASCAAPYDGEGPTSDGAANHPITVEPHFTSIKLSFSVPEAGLLPDDSARLDSFVTFSNPAVVAASQDWAESNIAIIDGCPSASFSIGKQAPVRRLASSICRAASIANECAA